MKQFLSIEELAKETALEESLIRFYESEHLDELPKKVLRGDTLFFPHAAVNAFKRIHAGLHPFSEPELAKDISTQQGYARVIAVTSGKGGVGKSNLALNLAIALQRQGKMAVVIDADLGMANIHLLCGITPQYTLQDVLRDDVSLSDIIASGPEGIGIVPGGSGVMAMADSTPQMRARMLDALQRIEQGADYIIVDTAAGMGAGVRDFLSAADEIIFVLTQDITSLADAYGLLKSLCKEKLERPVYSVINMVGTLKQAAAVAVRFTQCAEQFLGASVQNIGYVMKDSSVGAATVRRTPYSLFAPESRVSKNTANIAQALLKNDNDAVRYTSAFQRYMNLLDEIKK